MISQPWIMILDGEEGQLGGVALQLVRFGVDAVYAKHLDEAVLQALEHAERIGAILIDSSSSPEDVARVVEQVARRAGLGAESLAILGKRPDDARCEELAKLGIRWRLWSPFDEGGLRFIARAPCWIDNDSDIRIDLRVPTNLNADTICRGEPRRTLVSDLSTSGAYLETPSPFSAGDQVEITLTLGNGPIQLSGDVRWVNASVDGRPPAARPPGMGIEFTTNDNKTQLTLRQHLAKVLTRYQL